MIRRKNLLFETRRWVFEKKLERFEPTFMIVFWGFLIERINIVNKSLQIGVIQYLRKQFNNYENQAKNTFQMNLLTEMMRKGERFEV